jgi:predicted CXXCH cytochrome family protein
VASWFEVALVGFVAVCAGIALLRAAREARRARWFALAGIFAVATLGAASRLPSDPVPVDPARPRPVARGEYVSSNACRSCHPSEHASWHRTYHRTMTQDATPANVRAPLDGRALALDGRTYRLARRGEEIWASLPDPDVVADAANRGASAEGAPDVERRVVISTGSHHEQAYWVAGRRPGELRLFPFVWMIREERWVPRRDAFLQPPDAPPRALRWNSNCIACHAVGGRPGHDLERDAFDTRVVELGIACEACHGPGGEHVRRRQDPFSRWAEHGKEQGDPTITNPARLEPSLSAAVCGQCHSYAFPRDEDDWWKNGYALGYRPGQTMDRSRTLFSMARLGEDGVPRIEAEAAGLFWPDGTIRVGGREYNGLVESPCFTRGSGARQMTCLSCHSMHEGEPDDLLAKARTGDRPCFECHEGKQTPEHTHHPAGSSGSSCVECHMPFTTYALFKAIRSHRIDSPSAVGSLRSGKPNACNICHLDRTLAFTQGYLERWYGVPHADITGEEAQIAASVLDALRGDAAQRVLAAASFERESALAASGRGWQAPVLAELLVDPYAAVRFVAGRSLRALPGYAAIEYDFLAAPEVRAASRAAVLERFARAGEPPRSPEARRAVGLTDEGAVDAPARDALLARRDTHAITIAE